MTDRDIPHPNTQRTGAEVGPKVGDSARVAGAEGRGLTAASKYLKCLLVVGAGLAWGVVTPDQAGSVGIVAPELQAVALMSDPVQWGCVGSINT